MSRIVGSINSTYDRAKTTPANPHRLRGARIKLPSVLADHYRVSDESRPPADEKAQARRGASRRAAQDVPETDRRTADRRQQKPGLVGLLIDLLKVGHAKKRDDD
jgi:hypothetical protein